MLTVAIESHAIIFTADFEAQSFLVDFFEVQLGLQLVDARLDYVFDVLS